MFQFIDMPEIKEELAWLRENIHVLSHDLPDWILSLADGSSPAAMNDKFSRFGVMAYFLSRESLQAATDKASMEHLDEVTLYVLRLFSVFWVEKLRRAQSIEFEAFPIFQVEYLDTHPIQINEPEALGFRDTSTKECLGSELIGGFWNE